MHFRNNKRPVVLIISITSDIGYDLANRYISHGYIVIGTYRSKKSLSKLNKLENCYLLYLDLEKKKSINDFIKSFRELKLSWNIFISCPCDILPLKPFFKCNFNEFEKSVHINAIEQLRVLHKIYSFRNSKEIVNVVFFAAGGVNNAVVNISAYTISKIMLIKMCEFLDEENPDFNIFIVGPGWVKTKIHNVVLSNLNKNDEKYLKTKDFLENGNGTNLKDIFDYIYWLCQQGKKIASGRNFSVEGDPWKDNLTKLYNELINNSSLYKLRRYGNNLDF